MTTAKMRAMRWAAAALVGVAAAAAAPHAGWTDEPAPAPLYANDFEKAEVGKVPDELMVLSGEFAVAQDGGDRVLALPGEPLDMFGFLFGPAAKEGVEARARIRGESKGRRFPRFGVGLNGVTGYGLEAVPAERAVELTRQGEVRARAALEWRSGAWLRFRLRVRRASEGLWAVEGKVWAAEGAEPEAWMVSAEEKEELPSGRAFAGGTPYVGLPIQFDDLAVVRCGEK